jgi:EAL domain-containing protein (putative c-di-GMP-specific phosphodiesterase class I)
VLSGGLCGIGRYPDHGSDARAVLRASVAALREAERLGLPYAIYDERNDQARRRVASLLPDLHQALRTGDQLALHYQPKLKLDTGLCIGVEALIRWTHPERGPIPPGQFIGLAEKTALIGPLTEWVLAAALRQLAVWKRDGIGLSIAINASVRNLEDPAFPVIVADRLAHYGVDPSRLEIEITESALMSAPDRVRLALNELRGLGVSVALDDFGTGHSSLTYLRDLPANTLKLDRSYLRNLRTDHKSRLIVRSTIETAHELGFRVVAEGIEDRESYERLGDLACDIGQGFYICRPLPAAELCGWLRSRMVPAEGVAPAGLTATGQG